MKILHVISSGGLYGAEAVILNLAQALQAGGDSSEIAVFRNLPQPNEDLKSAAESRSISTHSIPCQGQLDLSVSSILRDLVQSIQPDVVHAHGYKADLYAWAALRNARLPLVSTCHTWYDNNWSQRLYGTLDRSILRRFAAVIAVSADVRSRLLAAGVAPERVALIPNGIDTEPFARAPKPAPPSGSAKTLTVGLVGRLAPEKGIDLFLHAAAQLLPALPDLRIHIIGEGPERATLDRLILSLGLAEHASLLGRQSSMPEVYASLDLLVSSSRQEGLPIALLEAMASGCAILATAVGEVPSIILDDQTGVLVAPENVNQLASAMLSLLADPARRERLGQQARTVVAESFSARRMSARYRELYTSVTEGRPPGGSDSRKTSAP